MAVSALSDSQKLDLLIKGQGKLEIEISDLKTIVTRVTTLEAIVTEQDNAIKSLQQEVRLLKDRDNVREQCSRGNALRLFNFPGSDSETNLASKVYDKLLKPILVAAKAKGDYPTVPQVGTTIEEVFRVGKFAHGSNKPPPPIIIKFSTPAVRIAVLKNKRVSTPSPEEGQKRMVLVEDLTPATHKKMTSLLEDQRVAKVWSMGGVLWYVKRGDNQSPKQVKSIFDSNDAILK